MNMEDEDEYVDYYDFSKTYKNHPLLIQPEGMIKEAGEGDEASEDDPWEDCDLDDDDDDKEDKKGF